MKEILPSRRQVIQMFGHKSIDDLKVAPVILRAENIPTSKYYATVSFRLDQNLLNPLNANHYEVLNYQNKDKNYRENKFMTDRSERISLNTPQNKHGIKSKFA